MPSTQPSTVIDKLARLGRIGSAARALQISKEVRWLNELSDHELSARGLTRSEIVARTIGLAG
ncbi:MAG: hypothetical protein AAGC57_06075 [Pseudomonadota bacterium]